MVSRKLVARSALCLPALAFALPVLALERISPEVFLDMAVGKLLTFHDANHGFYVGTEEFLRRDLSVWKDTSNLCVYGRITIENEQLCFLYDGDADGLPICWWTFRQGDRLLVRTARFVDTQNQEVTRIADGTLDCPEKPAV